MFKLIFILTLIAGTTLQAQNVVINEVLTQNKGLVKNAAGKSFDYIELFNTTSKQIDISGYFLSDDKDTLKMFKIPNGVKINPKGYVLLWANGDASIKELNTNFKLSQKGETLYLSYPNGTICHSLKYKRQFENISFGLLPNGGKEKAYMPPTPRAANKTGRIFVADLKGKSGSKATISLNPNSYSVKITNPDAESLLIKVLDNKTDKILYKTKLTTTTGNIHFATYDNGKYQLIIGKDTYRILKQ